MEGRVGAFSICVARRCPTHFQHHRAVRRRTNSLIGSFSVNHDAAMKREKTRAPETQHFVPEHCHCGGRHDRCSTACSAFRLPLVRPSYNKSMQKDDIPPSSGSNERFGRESSRVGMINERTIPNQLQITRPIPVGNLEHTVHEWVAASSSVKMPHTLPQIN